VFKRNIEFERKDHDANSYGTFDLAFQYLARPFDRGVADKSAGEGGLEYARVWSKSFSIRTQLLRAILLENKNSDLITLTKEGS